MSGPLSSNEIEDFVSSVRRLVSVDARPRPPSRDLAQDRLVLTSALQIVPDAVTDSAPLILNAPVKDEPPTLPSQAATLPDDGPGSVQPAFEPEWEEELWAAPDPPLSELALGAEEAEVVAESPFDAPAADIAATVADASADEAPWAEVGEDWLDGEPFPAAEAEAVKTEGPSEPPSGDRPAGRADVLKLSAEDMLTDGDGNPLTVLDEAALQQIIRQLIREELKGVLGERITQSVRKLVRAEINRALAAHSLD